MGLPFGGLGASLDFARIFYFSVSKNHFNTLGTAEHPFQHVSFFFSSDAFGELGAFFLAFWDSIFALWEYLGRPFWHLRSTLGSHFGVSEALWEAIFALRDQPRGPWEQQDGHEVANDRIFVDLGMISGLIYLGFSGPKIL